MAQQKNEAERMRLGISGGWLRVAEAVAWADTQIAQAPDPPASLLDIALAGKRTREEVAGLLATVPGSADTIWVMRACLADLLGTVEREPTLARDAARWLAASSAGRFAGGTLRMGAVGHRRCVCVGRAGHCWHDRRGAAVPLRVRLGSSPSPVRAPVNSQGHR
jgi:hypothetical protein